MALPHLIWTAFALVVGLTVGSFLNVCIWRMPRRCLSIFKPNRSFCPSCKHRIAWYDNLPILSFVALRARCRHCKAAISVRYPIVELITGLLFAGFYWLRVVDVHPAPPQWSVLVIQIALCCAILVASFIDWDFMIIPDRITKPGLVIAPILGLTFPEIHRATDLVELPSVFPHVWIASAHAQGLYTSLVGMMFGAGIIYGMGVAGKLLFRKEAMGFGDVKFMGMMGGVLGWKGVMIALFIACVAGSIVGIVRKAMTGDSYIPFGPFLGLGAFSMLAFGEWILGWTDARFGALLDRMAERLGTGATLGLVILLGGLLIALIVRRSRRRPPPDE
ncbi:MAG: prepilin peptidase [Planctomycetota bacterium]|nr:prepilin peptidase [Planctomycetota bacterium]